MIDIAVPCLTGCLRARAVFAGPDLWVLVDGGDAPHVGSVSLALPRPSLTGDGAPSATVSTLNAPGHKDDAVGDRFAAVLAARFSCLASVSCGIHFDHPAPEDLDRVLLDAESLLDTLVAALEATRDRGDA